jgi:hypothetical protein
LPEGGPGGRIQPVVAAAAFLAEQGGLQERFGHTQPLQEVVGRG